MAGQPNIVVARLGGGLGNQLFQYAAGRARAAAAGADLALDRSVYDSANHRRRYMLERFGLGVPVLAGGQIDPDYRIARLPPQVDLPYGAELPVLIETDYDFTPDPLAPSGPAYVMGHWQSWRWFHSMAGAIRDELLLPLSPRSERLLAREGEASQLVAVHVRRGDYLEPRFKTAFGLCEADYYRAAMDGMRAALASPRFLLFSDDPAWCRQFAASDCKVVSRRGGDPVDELMLMARCRHFILSNSSFAWWGAWLGSGEGTRVAAPIPWYTEAPHVSDLVRADWIRLDRATGARWRPITKPGAAELVSVILRTTGNERRLRQALDLVGAQDYPNIELIIVGAGAVAAQHSPVAATCIETPGRSPNAARNAGVAVARGRWIAFLDDEDRWLAHTVRTMVETAELARADGVICRTRPIAADGDPPPPAFPPPGSPNVLLRRLLDAGAAVGGGSGTLVRLAALRSVGGLNEMEHAEAGLGLYPVLSDRLVLAWARLVESPRPFLAPDPLPATGV